MAAGPHDLPTGSCTRKHHSTNVSCDPLSHHNVERSGGAPKGRGGGTGQDEGERRVEGEGGGGRGTGRVRGEGAK